MPFDGTPNPVNEILFGAIEYLEKYGWCQDKAVDGSRTCVWGALRAVAGSSGSHLFGATVRRIVEANPEMAALGIPNWNDVPGRTKEEALAVLARAISGSDIWARRQQ